MTLQICLNTSRCSTQVKSTALDELTQRTQDIFQRIVISGGRACRSSLIASEPASRYRQPLFVPSWQLKKGPLFSPIVCWPCLTQAGLKLFVDGLALRSRSHHRNRHSLLLLSASSLGVDQLLEKASLTLSGLSRHASLILSPTEELAIRHIEFVPVQHHRILVILVYENGRVENRLIQRREIAQNVLNEAAEYEQAV